jgi:hypothetical protein
MAPDQLESVHNDLTLDIFREAGDKNFLNRYVQNPQTGVIAPISLLIC